MGIPLMLVVVGQQIFRIAATATAKKAVKKVGGKIVKKVPEEFKKKKVKNEFAFQKLFLEKEPTFAERIGNLFVRKPKKVKTDSPGRTNVDEGIVTGQTRTGGFGRGEQVKGAGKALLGLGAVGGAGVLAYTKIKPGDTEDLKKSRERLKQLEADLKKSESEKKAAQTATAIEREIRKIMTAENKKVNSMSKVKPKLRPSGNSKGGMIDYRKTGLFK
tara:strand:+ start:188 stop:838 length:651 start_codon:yes stop_codon:yes gene_type:complete